MAYRFQKLMVEFDSEGEELMLDVRGLESVRGQVWLSTGTYGSGVVTMERSLDGVHWAAMGTAQTFSADGMSGLHDCQATGYVRLRVSTAGTSGAKILLALAGWTNAPDTGVTDGG